MEKIGFVGTGAMGSALHCERDAIRDDTLHGL